MTEKAPSPRARFRLSLDGWAVLSALMLTGLIWANLLPPVTW
jgi:hypothetical protein